MSYHTTNAPWDYFLEEFKKLDALANACKNYDCIDAGALYEYSSIVGKRSKLDHKQAHLSEYLNQELQTSLEGQLMIFI